MFMNDCKCKECLNYNGYYCTIDGARRYDDDLIKECTEFLNIKDL